MVPTHDTHAHARTHTRTLTHPTHTHRTHTQPQPLAAIVATAADTVALSKAHALECGKSYMQVDAEMVEWEDAQIRHADYLPRVTPGDRPEDDVQEQGTPGLIFNSKLKQVVQPKAKAEW